MASSENKNGRPPAPSRIPIARDRLGNIRKILGV